MFPFQSRQKLLLEIYIIVVKEKVMTKRFYPSTIAVVRFSNEMWGNYSLRSMGVL